MNLKSWRCRKPHKLSPLDRESGVVAVEFIFLLPVLMLILAGVVEFGHLMYVRHTLTNASREGARAAVVYTGATGDRSTDAEKLATDAVKKYMQDTDTLNTIGACKTKVTFPTGGTTGKPVTVMVTASGGLLMLDNFITSLSNITVSAETTMRLE